MLTETWPIFAVTITTPRLVLHLPREQEISEIAQIAANGVHPVSERPFLTPWTDSGPTDRARFVLREHWSRLADWRPDNWCLGMGVFLHSGQPLGIATLRARDFSIVREVTTSSWLGLPFHRQGYGTEARTGLLTLAFDHLHAEYALSEAFQDNAASQAVSRKLGYEPDGISRDARGDEVLVSDRLRLAADRWRSGQHEGIEVSGLEQARGMLVS